MDGLVKIKYKSSEDNICSICLNNKIDNCDVFSCKRCGKSFHEDCIYQLIKYKNQCPLCRYTITNFIEIDPEIILFSRDFMLYHYSAFQFIIFINFVKTVFTIIIFIMIGAFFLYYIFQ